MNQTKPKTIEQILKQFDGGLDTWYDADQETLDDKSMRDFIRTSITTLLESLMREDIDTRRNTGPIAYVAYGYNQRNKELEEDINKILGI